MQKSFFLFGVLLFACCNNNKNPYANSLGIEPALAAQIDTAHYTAIKWVDSVISFGVIKVGDSVRLKYRFINSGNTPLFILETHPGCGCTVTNFSKEPVMRGKSGFVTATLQSGFHTGEINKTIAVVSNTRNKTTHVLFLRGYVEANKKIQNK